MRGDWLALGAVGALVLAGAPRRGALARRDEYPVLVTKLIAPHDRDNADITLGSEDYGVYVNVGRSKVTHMWSVSLYADTDLDSLQIFLGRGIRSELQLSLVRDAGPFESAEQARFEGLKLARRWLTAERIEFDLNDGLVAALTGAKSYDLFEGSVYPSVKRFLGGLYLITRQGMEKLDEAELMRRLDAR